MHCLFCRTLFIVLLLLLVGTLQLWKNTWADTIFFMWQTLFVALYLRYCRLTIWRFIVLLPALPLMPLSIVFLIFFWVATLERCVNVIMKKNNSLTMMHYILTKLWCLNPAISLFHFVAVEGAKNTKESHNKKHISFFLFCCTISILCRYYMTEPYNCDNAK
jgi:hypothetical protein